MKQKIVVLASGAGTLFESLVNYIKNNNVNYEISLLITDQKDAPVIKNAIVNGIKFKEVVLADFLDRSTWNQELIRIISQENPEWIFSLGFMKILDKSFIQAFHQKVINVHPSYLPAFKGLSAVQDALDAKVVHTGATVHFIDEGVDTGPIILQQMVPVLPEDTKEKLHERIKKTEREMICEAMDMLTTKRVSVLEGKVVFT
jgi:phosphoribosylglycinamide formyltransferase-1